ncbi:MAG: glycosyltransferase family 4 protein, partial [Firmicutes bacterium]|nr:glycosyltransferase family 4 protein [Bacillota bacterium]
MKKNKDRDLSKRNIDNKAKKDVLFLVNSDIVIYNFRLELVERLIEEGYTVHVSSPYGKRIDFLTSMGVVFHETKMERHGMNPLQEVKLLNAYRQLIKEIKPKAVLTYTVKPNIYGGIASRLEKVPFISNITGLGIAIENGGLKQKLMNSLYKVGLKGSQIVFFQNDANREYMLSRNIVSSRYDTLPGSGVNVERFSFEPYPEENADLIFSVIGRIMKDKGTGELIEAAKIVKDKHPRAIFRLIGYFDDDYEGIVKQAESEGIVEYCGSQIDVKPFIKDSFAIIQPSHHEGMSNTLLESA